MTTTVTHRVNQPFSSIGPSQVLSNPTPNGIRRQPALAGAASAMLTPLATKVAAAPHAKSFFTKFLPT